MLVTQLGLTLCNPMDCRPPGSSAYGIFQARYGSGLPFFSSGDLPNSGIEPRSAALQADPLPSEPPGKPSYTWPLPSTPSNVKKKKKSENSLNIVLFMKSLSMFDILGYYWHCNSLLYREIMNSMTFSWTPVSVQCLEQCPALEGGQSIFRFRCI